MSVVMCNYKRLGRRALAENAHCKIVKIHKITIHKCTHSISYSLTDINFWNGSNYEFEHFATTIDAGARQFKLDRF